MQREGRKPLYRFWTPNYWSLWCGLGLLRISCWLPYKTQMSLGRWVGRIAHRFATRRRAITRRNLALAFPELSSNKRNALALAHFESLGMSLMEMGLGRWASDEKLLQMTRIEGVENLKQAASDGVGIILLSAHFTSMEISGRVLSLNCPPFDVVYRRGRNEFMTEILRTTREVSGRRSIEKNDIKSMLRSLREGTPVWYAPDQSYNRKGAETINFFGVPTMQTTATSTLARLGKAVTIPFFPRRLQDGSYEMTLFPPFENFPSDDPAADTSRYNDVLEEHIRSCPEQYFWIHRKFKDLPNEYPNYYADLAALK